MTLILPVMQMIPLPTFVDRIFLKPFFKSHFLLSPYETKSIQIQNSCIKASFSEELLGIKIDSNLTFHNHITSLCSKANKKLSALSRVSKYMNTNKRHMLMKSYIFSQLNYCPLGWMCHSRSLNSKINQIQEKALQIVYRDLSPASKNFFKKINLSLSTRKTYSTLR